MVKEIFDKAIEAHKRVEFYTLLEKTLNASGVETIIHPALSEKFGKEFVKRLKDDLLPSVSLQLKQAEEDFSKL